MSNFYERIALAAAHHAGRPAVERTGPSGTETLTYAALLDLAARAGAWLQAQGVRAGDRVAMLAANEPRWVAAYLGILKIGAIVVPLDTAYDERQVAIVLADSRARAILTSARYLPLTSAAVNEQSLHPIVVAILSDATVDEAPAIWSSSDRDRHPVIAAADRIESQDGALGVDDRDAARPAPDRDAAVILYTSGTTADPKGVVLTHENLNAEATAVLAVVRATHEDVVLGVLPLFHALAQTANLLLPLSVGAKVIFLEQVTSTTLLGALATRRVTVLACVPQFFYLIREQVVGTVARRGALARGVFRAMVGLNGWLRDRTGWNPGRLVFARVHRALGPTTRLLITGGSRFDPAVARDLYGLGLSVLNGYGLTETSGAATLMRPGDRFTQSVGHPLPGVDVRIDASSPGLPAEPNTTGEGEILIRGAIVMRGYWNRPDATADVLRDGWFRTGDLGTIDHAGRVYITGRQKDVIVLSSGKNLYPEEIEAHYGRSPFIKELCVLGRSRPGEPAAERLHAVIVPNDQFMRERGVVNVREVIRFELEGLSVSLPAHKRVLSYEISMAPLPRTSTGKLKRADIERRTQLNAEAATAARDATPDERSWLDDPRRAALVRTAARQLGSKTVLLPDANLELDLGLDSMERIELLTVLEQQQRTRVSAEGRAGIFTLRQLVDAVIEAEPADGADASTRIDAGDAWAAVLTQPAPPALVRELTKSKWLRALVIHTGLRAALLAARLFIGFRASGRERLPREGPFIVSPNHQTFLDGAVVATSLPFRAFERIFFVGAAEFFETPLAAWLARTINIIPLDPDANLVSAMQAAATGLRLGKVLILFPEGERSIDGEIKTFRKGVAILASELGVPVVPVGLDGLFPLWSRGRTFNWSALLPWRRLHARLLFGTPRRLTGREYAAATADLQQDVTVLQRQIRSDR